MKIIEEKTKTNFLKTDLTLWEWLKGNRYFLIFSLCLLCMAIGLTLRNHLSTHVLLPTPVVLETTPKKVFKAAAPKQKKIKSPFWKANAYLQKNEILKAQNIFLELSKTHPDPKIRHQAALGAHQTHTLYLQKENIKKQYLEGYILYRSYPQKACEIWGNVLQKTNIQKLQDDPYLQKLKAKMKLIGC